MKKILIITFLALPYFSYSNQCEFTGKVTPEDQIEKVRTIYRDMCEWFTSTFPENPLNPEISLNEVSFIESLEGVEHPDQLEDSNGIFYSQTEKNVSKIIMFYSNQHDVWMNTPLWQDSALAHEIFHYLKKSCCFKTLSKVKRIDTALMEASAYWAQDQFVRRHSNQELMDLIWEDKKENVKAIRGFMSVAYFLYNMDLAKYVHNALIWFGENPQTRFNNIVEGYYTIRERTHRRLL